MNGGGSRLALRVLEWSTPEDVGVDNDITVQNDFGHEPNGSKVVQNIRGKYPTARPGLDKSTIAAPGAQKAHAPGLRKKRAPQARKERAPQARKERAPQARRKRAPTIGARKARAFM